jgi:hypothetical protein
VRKDLISDVDKKVLDNEKFKFIGEDIVIDEDFFDLKISILLPASPKRFQDDRFKAYVTELVRERSPAHITNNIFWLNEKDLNEFEAIYTAWEDKKSKTYQTEDVKSKAYDAKNPSSDMKKAAFEVYRKIIQFERKRRT